MAYVGQQQKLFSEQRAALNAIEMLVAVPSLSVPSLLNEYWLAEFDESEIVFKLNLRTNGTINKVSKPPATALSRYVIWHIYQGHSEGQTELCK